MEAVMLTYERRCAQTQLEDAEKLGKDLGVSLRTAQLLLSRGLTDGIEAEEFLHPGEGQLCDPFAFADMHRAVGRIEKAIANGERICVFGDYDADGVCATAILMLYLRSCNADALYMIPSRHDEGYGMNMATVDQLKAAGAKLVITVDNGVKAVDELARCYELGIEAIVTDHHIPGETLPRCEALLCSGTDGGYPNRHICGAGLAFKLVEALAGRKTAMRYVSLAGIATVADIVPLFGENRVFAARACEAIWAKCCPKGLLRLLEVAGRADRKPDAGTFGYVIGPRLNAAGRIEDAALAVELLIGEDDAELRRAAEKLNALNEQRRAEEAAIYAQARAMLEADDLCRKRSIVLYCPDWNPGVVGIAAGRIAERYYKPTLLLTGGEEAVTGSARSIPGVNIHDALKACEAYFSRWGGHAFAAGVTLHEENITPFRAAFDEAVRANVPEDAFIPCAAYDDEAEFTGVTMRLARELETFAPFGEGNDRVLLRTDGARIKNIRTMGEGKHLRLTLQKAGQYVGAVYFGAGDRFREINEMDACDVLYTPVIDDFNGESLQLELRALRAAPPADIDAYLSRNADKFADALSGNILYNSTCADFPFARAKADEVVLSKAREGISGLIVLCFTKPGAARFLALAQQEGLYARMDVCFTSCAGGASAYNAAVLAPALDALDIARYETLVVYDTPLGMGEKLAALAPKAKLILAEPVQGDADELAAALKTDRDALGGMYRALTKTQGGFYNRAAMADALCRESGKNAREAQIAIRVFEELGFVGISDAGAKLVENAPSRRLEESDVFTALNSIAERNEHYMRLYKEAHYGS